MITNSLKGKTAIIIGDPSGIGKQISILELTRK